eukprot:TRINITY_DN10189_c0_g2_i1.p1 TRINITY_DN10189_c0_g2~~TRINITY_DN10189_c0_g2_i1.p1  ORF type:complete len:345 (+),score=61.89 TRINITY_DN10189_c0_g2_i1:136-1170(+)
MPAPLVIEIGNRTSRLGTAGQSEPRHDIPTKTTEAKASIYTLDGQLDADGYMPALERAVAATSINLRRQPLSLIHSSAFTDKNRESLAELLFEKHSAPALYLANDATMALYSVGRVSGIVVDFGHEHTRAIAVHDGMAIASTLSTTNCGGKHLAKRLESMLVDRGHKLEVADWDSIMIQHARLACDFDRETTRARSLPLRKNVMKLPDGGLVDMTDDLLRCGEGMLRPNFASVGAPTIMATIDDIMRQCYDPQNPELYEVPNYVLATGGCARMPNLQARLQAEMDGLARCAGGCLVQCTADNHQKHAAWLGGSLVSQLPGFVEEQAITSAEYAEVGKSVVMDMC